MGHRIKVDHLVKSYVFPEDVRLLKFLQGNVKRHVVLDNIGFSVQPNEMLGVLGRNGAGKSTLLRVLGGVYTQDSGEIEMEGSVSSIFEMGTFLNLYQTGREYCREYLYLTGDEGWKKNGRLANKLIEDIQEFTELGEYFDRPIHTYSSGMRAKLLFGAATSRRADIFLIDEVLVVGDSYFQGKAWKRIRQMLDDNACGIIVSHDWSLLLKLCQRAILIENKKIAMDGPSREIICEYIGLKNQDSQEIGICEPEALQKTQLTVKPGDDFSFSFSVWVDIPPKGGILGVDCYIEQYNPKLGWNRLFNCESTQEINKPGVYPVTVTIPNFPVAPGDYFFSIEVAVPPLVKGGTAYQKVYTKMNWLNGRSIPLTVIGENKGNTLFKRKLQWEKT